MRTAPLDRRRRPRRKPELPQGIKLYVPAGGRPARMIAAKLVDASEGGVGVETYAPLRENDLVSVEGNLQSEDFALRLRGVARVVHSRGTAAGTFRAGLLFEQVAYLRSA